VALDKYVTLGRSGLRVIPMCLGAMTLGEDLGWGSSVEESKQIIDKGELSPFVIGKDDKPY
jgi:aryl-alcohol dehydrogenase-like predicted oxidoreductase